LHRQHPGSYHYQHRDGAVTRFPKARISDPNFTPTYGGAVAELRLQNLPMVIQQSVN
jgi:hypothetical protein